MPFLTKDDLKTHMYPEVIDEISRQDDNIIERAINAAIAEAKAYMSRFDLLALFGDANTEPTFVSEHLKNLTKDIACWHLIRLANPNVNLELFRSIYKDAVDFLTKVMKGQADPGWPYKQDNADTPADENAFVQWSSNPKRVHHW